MRVSKCDRIVFLGWTVPLNIFIFPLSLQLPCTGNHRYMTLLNKARLGKRPKHRTPPSIKTARKTECFPSPQPPSGSRRNVLFARTCHERQQWHRRFGTNNVCCPSTDPQNFDISNNESGFKRPLPTGLMPTALPFDLSCSLIKGIPSNNNRTGLGSECDGITFVRTATPKRKDLCLPLLL